MDPSWMFLFTEKYYSLWSQDKTLLGRVYFVVSLGHWGSCFCWCYQPSSTSLAKESYSDCSYLVLDTSILSACLGWKERKLVIFLLHMNPQTNHPDKFLSRSPDLSLWWTETPRDPPPLTVMSSCLYFVLWFPLSTSSCLTSTFERFLMASDSTGYYFLLSGTIMNLFKDLLYFTSVVWGRRQKQCTQVAVWHLGLSGSWEPFCCPDAESWLGSAWNSWVTIIFPQNSIKQFPTVL